ncbi:hypothetical protein [Ekhidna sp.]
MNTILYSAAIVLATILYVSDSTSNEKQISTADGPRYIVVDGE